MPLIKPSLIVITMPSVIWDFNVFNQIWLVSQGGPATTNRATANHGVGTILRTMAPTPHMPSQDRTKPKTILSVIPRKEPP